MAGPRCALRSERGLSTLGWLLVTAAVAALVGTATVTVTSIVRDVGIDAGSFSARFRAARIAADSLTREWRAHHPADQFEADALNRRYSQRCARLGITYADTEAMPEWKPGVLAAGGGWFEVHKLPVCSVRNVRGERERFRTSQIFSGQFWRRQIAWGLPVPGAPGSALLSSATVGGVASVAPVGFLKTASTSRLVSL